MKLKIAAVLLSLLAFACSSASKSAAVGGAAGSPDPALKDKRPRVSPKALTEEEAETRAKQIGRVAYVLWFGLDSTHEEYEGRAVLNFDLKEKARDASSDLFVDFSGGNITAMQVNGTAVAQPRYDGNRITFKLSELSPGANRVDIAFMRPYSHSGAGMHRFKDTEDGQVYLYTDFEPFDAHMAFPCFDQPDLKASFELTVETPENWQVISNTMDRDVETVDGRKSWAFPPSPVLSTYLFALHAGPYKSWKSSAGGIPIRLFARQSLAKHVEHEEWFDITRRGLKYYAELFDYPYPFAKYDQILVPEFNEGAMENAGAVTFTESFIYRSKVTQDLHRSRADVILHEMAHMWFGDLVTMRWWNGLWLNESFATFMAARAVDEATNYEGSWNSFFAGKSGAYLQDQLVTTHPVEALVPSTDEAFSNFDGITYGKGASVLKQLWYYLGEEAFRTGVRDYFNHHAFRNTTIADFMGSMSTASGKDLSSWQKLWLETSGVNTVKPEFTCADGKITSFTLSQSPDASSRVLRPHRTELALYYMKGSAKNGVVEAGKTEPVAYSETQTPVPAFVGAKCPDFVDVNHKDYDYAKAELDADSLKFALEHLSAFADPLSRQRIWTSLSEMVRDGKLPVQEFADAVVTHGTHEKDTLTLTRISSYLIGRGGAGGLLHYLTPEIAPTYLTKLEAFFQDGLKHAPAGSDLQLIYFQGLTRLARSGDYQAWALGVLNGKKAPMGLKIEQERRWELVQSLARNGMPEVETLITNEAKRDPSDVGRKSSISARAMEPDPANKLKWLQRFAHTNSPTDEHFKSADLKAAMRSFYQLGQDASADQAAPIYFEALPRLAKTDHGGPDFITSFAWSIFPPACSPSNIKHADEFLSSNSSLPAYILKPVRTGKQEDEICVRARALSQAMTTKPVKP